MTRAELVVVGGGESAAAHAAVEAAALEAQRRGARLRVVYCWDVPVVMYAAGVPLTDALEESLRDGAEAQLAELAADLHRRYPRLEVETRPVWGPPVAELVEASRDADLLVLACRKRRRLVRSLLGSTSVEISRCAVCPVRIVTLQ